MNNYKIIFTRGNGTQGTYYSTAFNERQARKDFSECYRHGTNTIISIELVSTNAPATKQQERDTLEKIRKMVEQLGPDSRLATTFEGCFDLAAENIDNDWACSMANGVRRAEKRVAELEYKLYEEATAAGEAQRRAEAAEKRVAELEYKLSEPMKDCDEETTRRAEAAEAEVIQRIVFYRP